MFPSLPKIPVYLFTQSSLPPSPQATTDLISVILYVCWAYFRILQHVFDSCCCMYHYLVPFHCWISSSLYQFPPLVYLFTCWCTFGLCEHSCVNIPVDMCFLLLGRCLGAELLGQMISVCLISIKLFSKVVTLSIPIRSSTSFNFEPFW